jgi:hypothetical protein
MLKPLAALVLSIASAFSWQFAAPAIAQRVNLNAAKEVIDRGQCTAISKAKTAPPRVSLDCDRAILSNRPDGKKELRFANKKGAGPIFILKFDNDRYGISKYDIISYVFFDGKKIARKVAEEVEVKGVCYRGGMADAKVRCYAESQHGELSIEIHADKVDRSIWAAQVPEQCDELDYCEDALPIVADRSRN